MMNNLTKSILAGSMALALTFTLSTPAFAQTSDMNTSDGWLFETELEGENEVPRVTPERVSGNGGVWFGENGAFMNFWLYTFAGDQEVTAAHLHCGSPGENGPPVVTLFEDTTGISVEGELARAYLESNDIHTSANCESVIGRDIDTIPELADAIDDELIYINVHSEDFPSGVARGQLSLFDSDDVIDNDDDDDDDDDNDTDDRDRDEDDDQNDNDVNGRDANDFDGDGVTDGLDNDDDNDGITDEEDTSDLDDDNDDVLDVDENRDDDNEDDDLDDEENNENNDNDSDQNLDDENENDDEDNDDNDEDNDGVRNDIDPDYNS